MGIYKNNAIPSKLNSILDIRKHIKETIDDLLHSGGLFDFYTKPSNGIPATDLSQEVRNSLLKADNAVPTAISTT